MKKFIKLLIYFAIFGFVLSSCNKYEDGPAISILTKKARLTGEWDLKTVIEFGIKLEVPEATSMVYNFKKDGDLTMSFTFLGQTDVQNADWEWIDQKEGVEILYSDNTSEEYEIRKLTNSELTLSITEAGVTSELEFEKKK